jgi:L-iditol 2-dehydrogenase
MDRIGHIGLIETDRPAIEQPNQVLVRIQAVGICRSEVHALDGKHPFRKPPVISGHEASGDVVAAGSAVTGFEPGDRVILDHVVACGTCEWCRSGDHNLCASKVVMGTHEWQGAFGEYVVTPEQALFRLPDNLSYVEGALVEPLMIAVHVARRGGVEAGTSVAILGTGSIGGLLVGVCRSWGADPIVGVDILEHPLEVATKMGATHILLQPQERLVERVRAISGGTGVDVAFVTADSPDLVDQALSMVRQRGRVVLVAVMAGEPVCLDPNNVIQREVQIVGSVMGNNDDMRTAIALAASGEVDVALTACPVLPIEEVARAMDLARSKDEGAIKVVLTFGDA